MAAAEHEDVLAAATPIDKARGIYYTDKAAFAAYPGVAQLVAYLTGGQGAVGSSPATRTTKIHRNTVDFSFPKRKIVRV